MKRAQVRCKANETRGRVYFTMTGRVQLNKTHSHPKKRAGIDDEATTLNHPLFASVPHLSQRLLRFSYFIVSNCFFFVDDGVLVPFAKE